ncbi:rubredoxin [Polaribacter reichenbachii]|uniref:Rubredoxin n=1 Tax=Polaribacter reichenbachii TaxID=996801 RepID=A0A1B8TRZ6_9FLAO|nr:rubredoxin [Polaribacter reichenbachii]APZ44926.1 rubredoxin [Polaribacter reichenbachii]AUC18790.1 rubredoxin [Polaribacter reichenbachii]OBY62380.1 rubredoxin [Polaribacter reichenbachii]
MRKQLNRVIVKGGVLSPGELKYICESVESLGQKTISFGSRQDILLPKKVKKEDLSQFDKLRVVEADEVGIENIVSSYVCADIFPSTSWLTGDRYLYILEQFRSKSTLKINITDPKQRLVPLFTGHINFIASEHEDYWYLYIRLPGWDEIKMYPALIYTWDLDKIETTIEHILKEEPETIETIFELVNDALDANNRTVDKPLEVPFYPFPYFEGMNKIGSDKYWLGLYWRNNKYDISFLKEMCELCSENKIGKISITPWKSFIVKGIPRESKLIWEKFLGKRGINVRHSMLELNWHLPVANKEALNLKKYLVANFDQNDISTYGLTFAITNYSKASYYFTSIVVQKNKQPEMIGNFLTRDTYNLLYAKDFDPNTRQYIMHVQDVDKVELPGLLMELSQLYFDDLGSEKEDEKDTEVKKEQIELEVYQCQDCFTIYDEAYGDITQNIAAETLFTELPENYECPLCEAPKSNFEKVVLVK